MLIGLVTVILVGSTVSLLTEPQNTERINPVVFTPFVRNYIIKKKAGYSGCNTKDFDLTLIKVNKE